MYRQFARIGLLNMSLSLMAGCATVTGTNHLENISHEINPVISIDSKHNYKFKENLTFTILPISLFNNGKSYLQNYEDRYHMYFSLRNMLEGRGYEFVSPEKKSDMIVVIDGYTELAGPAMKPQIKIRNNWSSGDTFDSFGTMDRIYQALNGEPDIELWGNYYEHGAVADDLSVKADASIDQENNYGHHQLALYFFDLSSKQVIWAGNGAGITRSLSTYLASQQLIKSLVNNIPVSKNNTALFEYKTGSMGISYSIMSLDGINYYPLITAILTDSPANKADITPGDILLKVNGQSVVNKTYKDVSKLLNGDACEIKRLILKHNNRNVEADVALKYRSEDQKIQNVMSHLSDNRIEKNDFILRPEFIGLAEGLTARDKEELDEVFSEYRKSTVLALKVTGHTDSLKLKEIYKERYISNQDLSYKRAQYVASYLQELLGLKTGQVSVDGMGYSDPVSSNKTREGRKSNRRIEIVLTHRKKTSNTRLCV